MSITTSRSRGVLFVCIVFASFAVALGLSAPATAADGGYPYAGYNAPGSNPSTFEWFDTAGKSYSPYSYYYRNCTDYVAWKLVSLGVPLKVVQGLHNAGSWAVTAAKRGLKVSKTPAIWSVAVREPTSNNQWGHVAFVEDVYENGQITVSEYNFASPGNFGRRTGTPAQLGFSAFVQFGISPPPKATPRAIQKSIGPDGAQQLYTATQAGVFESWWRDGQGVHTSQIVDLEGVVDVAKQSLPDGTQLVYSATKDGVWESWWRPGTGVNKSKIISLDGTKKVFAEMQGTTHVLYVLAQDGPYEYWWRDGGDGIHKTRLAHIINPVGFTKTKGPSGEQQVYTATAGAVFETWWLPGQGVHTAPLISISQNNIVDLAKQRRPDGTQLLYTATTNGVWETWWKDGHIGHGDIIKRAGIHHIQKTMQDKTNQLYVATDDEVWEYWWQPWQPIGSGRLLTTPSIVAIQKTTNDSIQQLYTASDAQVSETWWGGGVLKTDRIVGF